MPGQALSVHREKRIATEFPDLNLLDYHVTDALSEAVYRQRREKFATTDELKTAIMAAWEEYRPMEAETPRHGRDKRRAVPSVTFLNNRPAKKCVFTCHD